MAFFMLAALQALPTSSHENRPSCESARLSLRESSHAIQERYSSCLGSAGVVALASFCEVVAEQVEILARKLVSSWQKKVVGTFDAFPPTPPSALHDLM
jgi:hypothetical protein